MILKIQAYKKIKLQQFIFNLKLSLQLALHNTYFKANVFNKKVPEWAFLDSVCRLPSNLMY